MPHSATLSNLTMEDVMRLGVTTAVFCCLVWLAPLSVQADDGPDSPANQAEETQSPRDGLKDQLPDRGQLQSLLGTLIRHLGTQRGAAPPADAPPPQPQSGSRITGDGDLIPPPPAPDTETQPQPPARAVPPPFVASPMRRHPRRSAFSQRLLQRRLALIERIRADALAHGDADMAARSEQLEAFVVELHEVGLAGMAQRLGDLGALSGGSDSAAPSGNVEFPDTDFGDSAPLPETELGAPADLGDPGELGTPETQLPPELPPPAVPDGE
jgi:hypothetical protein